MISSNLSNRLVFIFSLLGLFVSAFLFYEYNISGPIVCPVGGGCDVVRASQYSHFLGISIPILGIIFYLFVAALSLFRAQHLSKKLANLQIITILSGVGFGMYLTFLEIFVIQAICFWCVLSFIITLVILLSAFLGRWRKDDNRD